MILLNSQNPDQAKQRKVPLYLAFAVPFTLQVVGIVGLVGYLSYRSGQQTVQDLTDQLLVKTENQVIQELDSYLSLPHEINQLNIGIVESGVVDLENLDQLHNYLITEHQKFPQVTSVHFGSPEGEFLVVHRVSPLEVEAGLTKVNPAQELLVEVGRSDPDNSSCLNLYALDQEGTIDRYLQTIKNIDVRERPWYRRAVKTQTSGWSDLFQIGTSNLLAINAYAPFYNASQELEGVFSINLSLEVLSDFLANLTLNNPGEVFIVERNGLLVANSAGELPYRTSRGKKGELLEPGNVQFRRIPAQESSNPVIAEATAALEEQFNDLSTIQSPQSIEFAMETNAGKKDPYFLRVFSYQDDYGLDWLMVTVVPKSEFTGTIEANVRRTIALSGVALLGSLGLGWWTSRRIARSLLRLSQASKSVAQCKFNDSFPTSRIREVDTLSESFSHMARSLQEAQQFRDHYESKLEREVEEKTAALLEAQQREIEATARELKLLEQILETTLAGYWDWDIVNNQEYLSPAFKRMFGYEDHELPNIPETWQRLIFAEDLPKVMAGFECHVKSGGKVPYYNEVRYQHKDGSTVWVICSGQVIEWDKAGNPLRMIGSHVDITALKETESALQESQAELQLTADSISGCICFTDSSLRYQFVNQTYEVWFNCRKEDMIGRTVEEVIGTEAYQQALPYIKRVLAGETVTYEKELAYKGGKTRYVSVVLTPKFDENNKVLKFDDNKVLGYYALITDISDRKQLELELKKANQQLEQLATVDGLTQLANRRTFDKRLQEEWNRTYRESLPLSLLLCDVDYFKKYNDYYGHQAGDNCLQKVALIIKENCKRAEDFPARYGGEEFVIICAGINADNARNLAENIQEQLFHRAIPHERNPDKNQVTLSIGIASMIPQQSDNLHNLLMEADRALYLAKEQGRDRVISFQL